MTIQPAPTQPQPGTVMADQTVFAGISSVTIKPLFAMPVDAELAMSFNEAAEYIDKLNAEKTFGHNDWRLPTKRELNTLFNSRAAIGGFNCTSDDYSSSDVPRDSESFYWSSSRLAVPCEEVDRVWIQSFKRSTQHSISPQGVWGGGRASNTFIQHKHSIRAVRSAIGN